MLKVVARQWLVVVTQQAQLKEKGGNSVTIEINSGHFYM